MSRRIAIVEDEPAIRANYSEALRKHGFEVAAYAGRAEALSAMKSRLPDLALIDIGLGSDVANDDLRAIATSPDHYHASPDGTSLAQIYLDIAAMIRQVTVTDNRTSKIKIKYQIKSEKCTKNIKIFVKLC